MAPMKAMKAMKARRHCAPGEFIMQWEVILRKRRRFQLQAMKAAMKSMKAMKAMKAPCKLHDRIAKLQLQLGDGKQVET